MVGQELLNYRIDKKLGAGGQGTVYKATDTKLGRTVVIKVLTPEVTAKEVNLRRFEREARLASSLDHPNICTIYGLHEVEGLHFIVMQYVEGRNVRELVDGRPLELQSALSIGIQVADALAAAHERGIIHRDIKAGNVMVLSSGLAKVLDFGLAKLLGQGEGAHDQSGMHLTEIGVPYGTATYAAPEQARGLRTDHRADIFSTGVLLYEMLTGTWPFRGTTIVDVRYAVLHETPQPVNQARPAGDVPPRLQQILDRALAKEPDQRYQKIKDLRDDLKTVLREIALGASGDANYLLGTAALVEPHHQHGFGAMKRTVGRWLRSITGAESTSVTSAGASSTSTQRDIHQTPHLTSTSQEEVQKSVAILPFRNLSNDPSSSFYEFSLADAVITELARIRSLVVRPSSIIAKYQGQDRDPRDVGRELQVDAVLAASFMRTQERLRVTAQLLDVGSGDMLWSDRIDVASGDIISVQDTIAKQIVDGLRIELSGDEHVDMAAHATRNATAYEEYLRGRDRMGSYIYHTLAGEDMDAAIEHFKRATELDSSFALAHAALGGCYANRVIKCSGSPEDYDLAESSFNKALALDPQILEARMHMIFIYLSRGQKKKARAEIESLRHEAPNDVGVHFVRSYLYRLDGEYDKALRSLDRMLRLNPAERVVVSYNRARIFMYQGRYQDAMLELDQGSAMEPDHPLIRTFRAVALYRQGNAAAAADMLREVLRNHPEMDGIRPLLAQCLSTLGDHEAARRELTERVKETATADHDVPYWLASAYALEGETDEAFEWLERAINLGNENHPWFESNPAWAGLRDDPRFRELMSRIKAPPEERAARTHAP
ncbi:MAG: protein kinase [Pyrinomonadaceae bacterium]|nr:protein kinase [Pyrinomonadaceae bacterium]